MSDRRAAQGRAVVALPLPPVPTANYVRAVAAGRLLFVSGHDPEVGGRLVYRGRIGLAVTKRAATRAVHLATLNALASAQATVGSLRRVRRCVVLTCFVAALPDSLDRRLTDQAVALVMAALRAATPPAVWLRPAASLAGGMPVEVELVLELRRPLPAVTRRGAVATGSGPPRS